MVEQIKIKKMIALNLKHLNNKLRNKTPEEIIDWALMFSNNRIVTTSFGSYSSTLLNAISKIDNNIDVVWCDTRYNTEETYIHALHLIHKLKLNIHIYKPTQNKETTDSLFDLSENDNNVFSDFKNIVKLEPFRRALHEHQPEIWFTNIRSGQTEHRNSLDILSYSKEGILKVSPFYYYSDKDLDDYLSKYNLPKNDTYFDVTKVLKQKECGIHFQ